MTDYHIECYLTGYLISARKEKKGNFLYMGLDGVWESIECGKPFDNAYDALKKMNELMKDEKPKYEARVTAVMVNKTDEPIFSETATKIEIVDESSGEYLSITQDNGCIKIIPEEWPILRQQIDEMIQKCREVKE